LVKEVLSFLGEQNAMDTNKCGINPRKAALTRAWVK
jgi:hypothetical protein